MSVVRRSRYYRRHREHKPFVIGQYKLLTSDVKKVGTFTNYTHLKNLEYSKDDTSFSEHYKDFKNNKNIQV